VVFNLYGARFHLLDANPKFGLIAPTPDKPNTIWFNIFVPDIKKTFSKAISTGCAELQAVTELSDYGVSNALFNDPSGYQWMLHQIYQEVSFEERTRLWEEKRIIYRRVHWEHNVVVGVGVSIFIKWRLFYA